MTIVTESSIETLCIELLEAQGYTYVYGPDIAPDAETSNQNKRESFEDVILIHELRSAVTKINPSIPAEEQEEAI